jgi:hypothetical protein
MTQRPTKQWMRTKWDRTKRKTTTRAGPRPVTFRHARRRAIHHVYRNEGSISNATHPVKVSTFFLGSLSFLAKV